MYIYIYIRFVDQINQHYGVLELHKWFATKHVLGIEHVRLGCIFRECVLPEGLAKAILRIVKIPQCSDFIDYKMVLRISMCTFDATNSPDAFKQVPDLF